jgi:hypothetical protein
MPAGSGALAAYVTAGSQPKAIATGSVDRQRHPRAGGRLEQQRRTAAAQHPLDDLGDLQVRVDRCRDTAQLAGFLELSEEVPQVVVRTAPVS